MSPKIPVFVKEFNQLEINKRQFSVKHSSVFRIMTKWAEYLNDIFEEPEFHIYQRSYPFKSTDNHLTNIKNITAKHELVNRIKKEHQEVKKKYQNLLTHCYQWIGKFLSDRKQKEGHVCRYSDTRALASKINSLLTHFMLKYLNLLIHHLIRAGNKIQTERLDCDKLSLVVFRVSDLMRSKIQCSESEFISLLRTLYLLDNSQEMEGKFKLVRIKNKLEDPASNIIINYLFLGQVQCELQLSIQDLKPKEKTYFTFSHFVYELTRGKFGTLAECVIMISQLDPMIAASKGSYYHEKEDKPLLPVGTKSR